ncbi:MAG: hypothetical protein FWE31_02510 [Firmicutes bacterium]|nr:hypothetical protein [Bacillota bacterium]
MLRFLFAVCLGLVLLAVPLSLVGCGNRQEFSHSHVSVELTQAASEIAIQEDRTFTVDCFRDEVALTGVIQSEFEGLISLTLELKYPSRANVLEAIEFLQERPDVYRVNSIPYIYLPRQIGWAIIFIIAMLTVLLLCYGLFQKKRRRQNEDNL